MNFFTWSWFYHLWKRKWTNYAWMLCLFLLPWSLLQVFLILWILNNYKSLP